MENSVNQAGTGSTKIYAVTWFHRNVDSIYTNTESTYAYSKYFPSKEEASEFANNLKSSPESWGANYDKDIGWNGKILSGIVCGKLIENQDYYSDDVEDWLEFVVHEVEVGKLHKTVVFDI